MKNVILLLICFYVSGCAWFGVESNKGIQVEKTKLSYYELKGVPSVKGHEVGISIGDTKKEVIELFGEPISETNDGNFEELTYPSIANYDNRKTLVIGVIPLSTGKVSDGKYVLTFKNGLLEKIVSFETNTCFRGVYTDDSGSGLGKGSCK